MILPNFEGVHFREAVFRGPEVSGELWWATGLTADQWRIRLCWILALNPAQLDALDEVALVEDEEQKHGDQGYNRAGH